MISVLNEETQEYEMGPCQCSKDKISKSLLDKRFEVARLRKDYISTTLEGLELAWSKLEPYSQKVGAQQTQATLAKVKSANAEPLGEFLSYVKKPEALMSSDISVLWLLCADPLSGKTSALTALAKSLIVNGYRTRFFDMETLRQKLINFKDEDGLAELEDAILKYDVFLIDDAFYRGKKMHYSSNDYVIVTLYSFFNKAVANGVKLVCSSNVDIDQIPEEYVEISSVLIKNSKTLMYTGTLISWIKNGKPQN